MKYQTIFTCTIILLLIGCAAPTETQKTTAPKNALPGQVEDDSLPQEQKDAQKEDYKPEKNFTSDVDKPSDPSSTGDRYAGQNSDPVTEDREKDSNSTQAPEHGDSIAQDIEDQPPQNEQILKDPEKVADDSSIGHVNDTADENPQNTPVEDTQSETTRPYALGFTPFPHALSAEAYAEAYEIIRKDADLFVMHIDEGIPWDYAFSGEYGSEYIDDHTNKRNSIPEGHLVYLAITPISFGRDNLAANLAKEDPWRARLDDPDVITAYKNHVEKMISIYEPDYLAYAIEANIFDANTEGRWAEFQSLAKEIYNHAKNNHPSLPLFFTIEADIYHKHSQESIIRTVLPYTDYIAVSAYPYTDHPDPSDIPADFFSLIAGLSDKPFAIAETCWPAEPITSPSPANIPGSQEAQLAYLERVLDDSTSLDAQFVTWFFTRDFDQYWNSNLKDSPFAPVIRIWKDCGLYDESGSPRSSHDIWMSRLSYPRE